MIDSEEEGFKLVRRSKKNLAFISTIDSLEYHIILSPPNTYYLPPQSEDSIFFSDTMAMVMHKNFHNIKEFDHL